MNAGPDVERLIADWLDGEAPARAPDRILESAAQLIDRTKQRRLVAAWREPMTVSMPRLVAALALVLAIGAGAAWLGRSTAGVTGPAPTPSATAAPSPTGSAVTLVEYRAAHDTVCAASMLAVQPLNDQLSGVYDPGLTAAQRASQISILTQIATLIGQEATDLGRIAVPSNLVGEHAADIARHEDTAALILQEVQFLQLGRLADAQGVDLATDPISRQIAAFESRWGLRPCP